MMRNDRFQRINFTFRDFFLSIAVFVFILLLSANCGYNEIQESDEAVMAGWSEVLNQYQRRADLLPNLVKVVKAYSAHESKVFIEITEARARAGAIQATPELVNDPVAFSKFVRAQGMLSSALSRLNFVVENYPELKADRNFRDLQAQIEGTENRITVARNRYIKAVQHYNTTIRIFPNNITAQVIGAQTKPTFTIENEKEISKPPELDL